MKSAVAATKRKIMPFLESVEEGLERATGQNTLGDELDPQKEQDKAECEAEGCQDHPDFELINPNNLDLEKYLI